MCRVDLCIAYLFSCLWFGKQVATEDEKTKVLVGTGSSSGLLVRNTLGKHCSAFVSAFTVP